MDNDDPHAQQQAEPWVKGVPWRPTPDFTWSLIATYRRYYAVKRNPVFVWAAWSAAKYLRDRSRLSEDAYMHNLQWIDDYFDVTANRLADLVADPPLKGKDRPIVNALGFTLFPGRGRNTEFSKAQQQLRDIELAAAVDALCLSGAQETVAKQAVADGAKLSLSTVNTACKNHRKIMEGD